MGGMKKTSCLVAVSGFLCLLGAGQNASATNYFAWSADAFGSGYIIGGGTSIDTTVKHSGIGSMKVTSTAGIQQGQGLTAAGDLAPISFGSIFYNRWWMKFDSAFTWSNQQKFKAQRWSNGSTAYMTGYLGAAGVWPGEHNNGFNSNQGAGSGGEGPTIGYNFNPSSNAAIKNWQEYIVVTQIQSSAGAADGSMKFYVNGNLTGQITGIIWWTGTPSPMPNIDWGSWMVSNYPQDANGSLWIDDVSLDSVWNSTTYPDPAGGSTVPPSGVSVK